MVGNSNMKGFGVKLFRRTLLGLSPFILVLCFQSASGAQAAWTCDGLSATVVGTPGDDVLTGTSGADVIVGREGNDTIYGGGGDDIVCAGKGDDVIYGGAGFDIIFGAQGDDLLHATNGRAETQRSDQSGARMFGGAGNDTIHGSNRWDRMQGGPGNDVLYGYEGRDWIRAGAGNDRVNGGASVDDLHGGNGADRILTTAGDAVRGGAGVDQCEVFAGDASQLISCVKAPLPGPLAVDQTGEDVVRIYRQLDQAHEYLRANPETINPYRFFEEVGGARTLAFMADRGFAMEPSQPGDSRTLQVNLQGRVSADHVQLFVIEDRREEGRRMLDDAGEVRWRDYGWDTPTRAWVVEMRRQNGKWRIAEKYEVNARGSNGSANGEIFTPSTIPDISATTQFTSGTATAPDGEQLAWQGHTYASTRGDQCIEVRIPNSTRFVECADAARIRAVQGASFTFSTDVIRGGEMGVFIGFSANTAGPRVSVLLTEDEAVLTPAGPGKVGNYALLSSDWIGYVAGAGSKNPRVASYKCNAWLPTTIPSGTTLHPYSRDAGRKSTKAELERFVLQQLHAEYAAPKVTVSREAPANTSSFPAIHSNPQWFVVNASDWDDGYQGITRKWAVVLVEDARGWYISHSGFRQHCA